MATYVRQSSFSDGDTITAALFNNEFNQLVNAFNVSTGHTHDGSTTGDGGPLSTLYSNALSFGTGADTDIVITFNANSNDGVLTWMEDEDYFKFSDDLLINSTEKVQFRDTAIYIYSSADGQLDLVADTEIQIAATTIDINGAADISGNLAVGGNLTVTGAATIAGNLTFGDAASDTVAFSADVASHLLPSADATYDLGASGSEWNNLYIDGTANIDSLVADTADINGGTVDGATIGASSATTIVGTTIQGTTITATTAFVPDASDGAALGTSSLEFSDLFLADGAVINFGDDQDVSLTHVADTGLLISSTDQLQFGDSGTYIYQSADGVLDLVSDTEIELTATTIDINGAVAMDGAMTGGTNITISGELDAATLDISGNADIDGTLEADAITVDGTALATYIRDTVGTNMLSSNTESGITVTYDTSNDNIDFAVDAAQTGITSIYATDLILGEDSQTAIDFGTANEIDFKADNAARLTLTASALYPVTDNEIDLGTSSLEFKDAFFDGTVTSDAFAGPLTGDVTGTASKATVTDSTANTNFPVVFHDESDGLLDDTGALRYNPSTGTLLVPNLSVAGTTTTVDTVTMEASNAIIFEGATADAHETTLSIVDPTGDHTQYLINQGGYIPVLAAVTTTAITSTPAELNVLDGVTAGTVSASLGVVVDSNKDIGSFRNITLTGELDAGSLDISGDIDVDGTANLDIVDIDGAVDMASTLQVDGAITSSAGATITVADNSDNLTLTSTDADASSGPNLNLYRNSGSPADNDEVANIAFNGRNDNSQDVKYAEIEAYVRDVSDGTEDGMVNFNTMVAGSGTSRMKLDTSETVFNDDSKDLDFRVETNGVTDALFVDGGNDNVQIGTGADLVTNTAGTSNFRAGVNAGNSIASGGNYNVVVGDEAGTAITTGDHNVAVGYAALGTEDGNGYNTAIGGRSLYTLNAGAEGYNTAVGYDSGRLVSTGIKNTLIGSLAGDAFNAANENVAVGYQALTQDLKGHRNVAIGTDSLGTQQFGTSTNVYNVGVGYNAGQAITTGIRNTIVGALAGDAMTDADNNEAFGYGALTSNVLGSRSTAIGTAALLTQNPATATDMYNVAVGYEAGLSITTGILNTLVGGLAGDALTTGQENVAVGYSALSTDDVGSHAVAIGPYALQSQNFATAYDNYNIAMGYNAGGGITTGIYNTIIGGAAGDALTDADDNVAIGTSALGADTLGSKSTAVGQSALTAQNFTTATDSYNVAVGFYAGVAVTTGTNNTLIGALAGDALTTGSLNTAIGKTALGTDTQGNRSIAVGRYALGTQNFTTSTESYNVAMGYSAGGALTTGIKNILIGGEAGDAITDADYNIAVGHGALSSNTIGSNSVAIGHNALFWQNPATATNMYNTGVGYSAGSEITTGIQNTFIGGLAGDGTDDGAENTALGYAALSGNCGTANTAVGINALTVATANNNTAVGKSAGVSVTSGTNNLLLGRDAGYTGSPGGNITTGSNTIVLGDENIGALYCTQSSINTSDRRDKNSITNFTGGLSWINTMNPVTYKWDRRSWYIGSDATPKDLLAVTPDGSKVNPSLEIGLIAQDVLDIEKANGYGSNNDNSLLVNLTDDETRYGLNYSKIVPILISAVKELSAKVEELEDKLK